MKLYKVYMDLALVMPRIAKFELGVYNSNRPIVFVEAHNPDDACFKALGGLLFKLMKQDKSKTHEALCRDIAFDIRVTRAHIPQ